MKLTNKIIIVLLAIFMANCADFADINKDETKLPDIEMSHVGAAFAYAQYHGMFIDRYDFELISSVVTNLYVQYFSNVTASFASDRLSAPDRFTRRAWATYYTKALPQIDEVLKMTKDNNPTAHAVALVWKVQIAHRITDLYGAMPYSDANNGQVNVKYDSQQEVYRLMFEDLNVAIEILSKNKGANVFGNDDQIYGGNVEKWSKFANSLKLRLAMRISDIDTENAKKYAEEAVSVGTMESAADDAFHIVKATSTAPYGWLAGWGETYMSQTMESLLVGHNDPRISVFFNKPVNSAYAENYRGARNGMNTVQINMAEYNRNTLSLLGSRFSNSNARNTEPFGVMNAAESYFIRAEGAIKGWNMGGTAKELYEKGIETAMKTWGINDDAISTYIISETEPSTPGGYFNTPALNKLAVKFSANTSEQLEQIAIQKYLALFPYNSLEMYADMRRTGLPKLYDRINVDDPDIAVNAIPTRHVYPEDELSRNKAEYEAGLKLNNGPDKQTTKLWWDVK